MVHQTVIHTPNFRFSIATTRDLEGQLRRIAHRIPSAFMPSKIYASEDLLFRNGNRLHMVMMRMVFVYSVFYSIYNYARGHHDQLFFVAAPMPSVLLSYFLFKRGRTLMSKVLLILLMMIMITGVCYYESQETFILAFFCPIIVGSLVTLQGPQRLTGYVMSFLSCLVLLYLIVSNFGPTLPIFYSPQDLQTERIMNLVGSSVLTAAQLIFIMFTSKQIQDTLVLRSQELSKINHDLTQTVATRDKLLTVLSHDLRSPLVVLMSGLDMLKDTKSTPTVRDSLTEQLSIRTRQTLSLVDNIILWSRNQAHSIEFKPAVLPTAFLKSHVDAFFQLQDQQKGVKLVNTIPDNGNVMADRDLLDTVIRNLIANAFKFTPAGGSVSVSAEPEDGYWRFNVTDTGKGMSSDILAKVRSGEPFTTFGVNKEKGHGLGLQMVRDFLKLHGSTLQVESEQGVGSRFHFRIAAA